MNNQVDKEKDEDNEPPNFNLLITVLVIILAIGGFLFYKKSKIRSECYDSVSYAPASKNRLGSEEDSYYSLGSGAYVKKFESREAAIRYCVSLSRDNE